MAQTGSSGRFKVGGLSIGSGANGAFEINVFTGTINTSTTWANTLRARPGSLLIDATGLKLYINTGTQASPTWTVAGAQS